MVAGLPLEEPLRLARAKSAHFIEPKILLNALFRSPGPEAPHLGIRRNALEGSNVIPTAKRPKQECLMHTSPAFAAMMDPYCAVREVVVHAQTRPKTVPLL